MHKGWSRQEATANAEDTEKEQKAHELLDAFRSKHGREGTMAEVFCDRLGLDPLSAKASSQIRFRDLGAGGTQVIPEIEGIDSAPRALDMMRVNGD